MTDVKGLALRYSLTYEQNQQLAGVNREITVCDEDHRAYVHDGEKLGGYAVRMLADPTTELRGIPFEGIDPVAGQTWVYYMDGENLKIKAADLPTSNDISTAKSEAKSEAIEDAKTYTDGEIDTLAAATQTQLDTKADDAAIQAALAGKQNSLVAGTQADLENATPPTDLKGWRADVLADWLAANAGGGGEWELMTELGTDGVIVSSNGHLEIQDIFGGLTHIQVRDWFRAGNQLKIVAKMGASFTSATYGSYYLYPYDTAGVLQTVQGLCSFDYTAANRNWAPAWTRKYNDPLGIYLGATNESAHNHWEIVISGDTGGVIGSIQNVRPLYSWRMKQHYTGASFHGDGEQFGVGVPGAEVGANPAGFRIYADGATLLEGHMKIYKKMGMGILT